MKSAFLKLNLQVQLKFIAIFGLVWIIGLVIGCENVYDSQLPPSPKSQLSSILVSSSDCQAPCWQGLTPGISTKEEVDAFFEQASPDLVHLDSPPYLYQGAIIYPFQYKEADIIGSFTIQDETLLSINFNTDFANLGLLLQQMGEPDTYSARLVRDIGPYISLNIFYENRGLVIVLTSDELNEKECIVELNNQTPLRFISFVEQNSSNLMFKDADSFFAGSEVIQKWEGIDSVFLNPCNQ